MNETYRFGKQIEPKLDANILILQRKQWTEDILRLMVIVISVATLLFGGGLLAGIFSFENVYPIFIVFALTLVAFLGTRRGRWRWASFLPAAACFSLGVYDAYNYGFNGSFVLLFALSVLLAGFLQGTWASGITVLVSLTVIAFLEVRFEQQFSMVVVSSLLNAVFCLGGIALVQWYFVTQLRRYLAEQLNSRQQLVTEIERRSQAETTQRDQAAQLRRLAENTTDMVAEIDPVGTMVFVSPSYLAGLGYPPEALMGSNAFDLVHPVDLPMTQAIAQQATLDHQPARFKVRCRHAAGHYIPLEISGRAVFDQKDQITGFILSSRDITLQNQAELALQESEEKFRRIVESLPIGLHTYTLNERDELIFTGYNPAGESILHTGLAPLIGKSITQAFPGWIGSEIPENYRIVAYLGGRWHQDQVFYQNGSVQGTFEITAVQTAPRKMVVIFVEITEQLKAAEALRLSEQKFSTAFKTSPDAVNINRLADGMYLDINQGFTRIMGYSYADVVGKSSLELNIWVDPADRARLVKGLTENGMVENLEAQFRCKHGKILVGLMSARVIEIGGEKCILSITRDISERKQAELELRQTHVELEQAYEATLQGWAQALELREKETAEHSRRVVDLTLRMASALGVKDDELLHIGRGALLHDIGKMGIPDGILLKRGPLSPEEWPIMRLHPGLAASLLNNIDYLRPALDIPYAHHEHWDGSGYPRGLHGDEIPLAARIFTVVDVYDALNSERTYRPAWSEADALRYLVEQKGKLFDPRMVDLFLEIIQKPG